MAKTELTTKIKPNLKLAEPSMYRVIYMNDEVTSMSFVVDSLIEHFRYSEDTAIDMATAIHEGGSAVVAVLPYEIAEQKTVEITIDAREQNYPLQVKYEAER